MISRSNPKRGRLSQNQPSNAAVARRVERRPPSAADARGVPSIMGMIRPDSLGSTAAPSFALLGREYAALPGRVALRLLLGV